MRAAKPPNPGLPPNPARSASSSASAAPAAPSASSWGTRRVASPCHCRTAQPGQPGLAGARRLRPSGTTDICLGGGGVRPGAGAERAAMDAGSPELDVPRTRGPHTHEPHCRPLARHPPPLHRRAPRLSPAWSAPCRPAPPLRCPWARCRRCWSPRSRWGLGCQLSACRSAGLSRSCRSRDLEAWRIRGPLRGPRARCRPCWSSHCSWGGAHPRRSRGVVHTPGAAVSFLCL